MRMVRNLAYEALGMDSDQFRPGNRYLSQGREFLLHSADLFQKLFLRIAVRCVTLMPRFEDVRRVSVDGGSPTCREPHLAERLARFHAGNALWLLSRLQRSILCRRREVGCHYHIVRK